MVHRCDKCPGTDPLRQHLETSLKEHEQITFQQWQTTDRSKMVTQSLSVDEFIDLLVGAIDNLTSHSFITKCQAKYLRRRKEELSDNCALVLVDFAEANYILNSQLYTLKIQCAWLISNIVPLCLYIVFYFAYIYTV